MSVRGVQLRAPLVRVRLNANRAKESGYKIRRTDRATVLQAKRTFRLQGHVQLVRLERVAAHTQGGVFWRFRVKVANI